MGGGIYPASAASSEWLTDLGGAVLLFHSYKWELHTHVCVGVYTLRALHPLSG